MTDTRDQFLNQRADAAQASAAEFFMRRRAGQLWDEGTPAPVQPKEETPPDGAANAAKAASAAAPSVTKDVAVQAVGGVRDAIQEGMEGIDTMAKWLDSKFPEFTSKANEAIFGDPRGMVDAQGNLMRIDLPEIEQPATTAGGLTRGVTQFLTGFIPAFKALKGGQVLTAGQTARRAVAAAAITDFAAFDPHQERLSDLIEQYPQLSNPITRYLQASPYDSDAEGRMKNVLEGFGVDMGVGGIFMAGLKGYRAARHTKAAPVDEVDAAADTMAREAVIEPKAGEPAPKPKPSIQFAPPEPPKKILGDPEGKLVKRLKPEEGQTKVAPPAVDDETAKDFLRIDAPAGNKALNINLARMNTSDDIKDVLAETADLFKADIVDATRGVQTNKATQELANHMGMTVDDLLARRKGEAFNAEQAVAARTLLASSADKLTQMARDIRGGKNGADDMYAFRRMVETHRAIQMQVSGLTAEAGRALQSFNIQAKSRRAQLRAIEDILEQRGGSSAIDGIADTLVKLADEGADSATISQTAAKLARVTSLDTLLTFRQGALLSGYRTHVANILSNTATMFTAVPERYLAGMITTVRGGDGVAMREGTEMLRGMVGGSWEALNIAARSFRENVDIDLATKTPEVRLRTITAANLSENNLGKAIGGVSKALGGKALGQGGYADNLVNGLGWMVDLPFRALGAEDAFFKHMNARMELHALAWRQAETEGLHGQAAAARAADLISNPPDEMLDAAVRYARVQTFTNPNRTAGAIQAALNQVKIARFIVPFVRTPTNLIKYGLDRTPVAPLFADVRADLAAGGSRRALAEARIAMGTSIMVAAGSLASAGKITGAAPKDPALRAVWLKENQPYSIKTAEGWVPYNRMDPWGMVLGMGADMWNASAAADDQTMAEMASMAVIGISNNVLNKTWMTGLADFMEAVNDPDRRGGKYIDYMMASFVPTLMKQMNYDLNDPVIRDFDSTWQAMMSRVPGFSDGLPAKRDIWGGLRLYDSGAKPEKDPLNELLIRRQVPVSMPPRSISVGNMAVRLTAEEYSRYVELARTPAKEELDTMVDRLEAIQGMGPGSGIDDAVKQVLRRHAETARGQLIQEFPEILDRREDNLEKLQ